MALVDSIAGALLGGVFDTAAGREANKANLQANQNTINDSIRSREESRNALTGTAGNVSTTRTPGGGFNSSFVRGSSGDLLNRGDVGRANAANQASTNFNFTLPNLQAAQGVVDRDNQLTQSNIDRQFDRATLDTRQQGLGPASSNFDANLARAQGEVADRNKLNREQQAINLLQQAQQGDIATLQNQIAANQMLAPTINSVGGTASQINAQIPLAARTSDVGSAILPAAGSNIIAQIQAQQAADQAHDRSKEIIRLLGNQGAFSGGR